MKFQHQLIPTRCMHLRACSVNYLLVYGHTCVRTPNQTLAQALPSLVWVCAQFFPGLHYMIPWKLRGVNTVCGQPGDDSGDIFSGQQSSMRKSGDCPKLCLTKPDCVFATYWESDFWYCYLYSASRCNNPISDTHNKGISWKRHRAKQGCVITRKFTLTWSVYLHQISVIQ